METDLLKLIEETMQREMDRGNSTHYQLRIVMNEKKKVLGADGSVVESYPILRYEVSFKDMTYIEKDVLGVLSDGDNSAVALGQHCGDWRLSFTSACGLRKRATDYFKEQSFKRLLDE